MIDFSIVQGLNISLLPVGYTQLEYIESSGTQYIDTGFKPNQDTRVTLNAYNLLNGSSWVFGAWTSTRSLQYAFSAYADYSFRYGANNVKLSTLPVGEFTVDFNKNAYNLNGETGTFPEQEFTCEHTMYLFAINANGSVSGGKFTGRIYSCKIYDNDVLVRDFIPAKRTSDGVIGLYDRVNGAFYTNAGSGSFTAGATVGGIVTKIEDDSGRVIWAVKSEEPSVPIVLEVEKITSDTYAGETTYTGEEFILLDIYPKAENSVVNVTYGGLSKTLTFSGTNAQQVYFGTFNGVADEVETPASGTLTIEGDCVAFACGKHNYSKASSKYCPCVTSITDFGEVEYIPEYAFGRHTAIDSGESCKKITSAVIPSSVTRIGHHAFYFVQTFEITMLATTPPTLTPEITEDEDTGITETIYAFWASTLSAIIVPKGYGEVYKAAEGWSTYKSKIVEAS